MDRSLLKPIDSTESLFKTFKKEAFRYESLPEYRVPSEKGELKYFRKYGKLNPKSLEPNKWHLMAIGEATKRGAQNWRIRRLSKRMSDYERMEVLYYKRLAPLGFKVWAFRRDFTNVPELDMLPIALDFWMFDEKTIVFVSYDLTGQVLQLYEYLGDPKPYIAFRNKLKKISKRIV
jgi:hypothetical protein